MPKLLPAEIERLHLSVPYWQVVDGERLSRSFKFKNFKEALTLVDRVGEVAEAEQHHPEISFGWGRATIEIWTHAIGGLTENDFILAAKIDLL